MHCTTIKKVVQVFPGPQNSIGYFPGTKFCCDMVLQPRMRCGYKIEGPDSIWVSALNCIKCFYGRGGYTADAADE